MTIAVYFGFIAAVAVWRLVELIISNRNAAHHAGQFKPRPEPLFKWMVLLHTCMYIFLPLEWWLRRTEPGGLLTTISLGVVLLALVLRIWTLHHIGKSWNVRIIGGEGYPICDTGPYAWIRHPNYLVVMLELFFMPLIAHLWITALVLSLGNGLVLFLRIRAEEKVLLENAAWVAKMKHKRRFIPGLF